VGRSGKRVGIELSFHSLRHATVSLLKDAGVPDAVVQALVGHESAAMSHRYTHAGKRSRALQRLFPNYEKITLHSRGCALPRRGDLVGRYVSRALLDSRLWPRYYRESGVIGGSTAHRSNHDPGFVTGVSRIKR
jgi:hypothetical protein